MVGFTYKEMQEGQLHWDEITPAEYQEADRQAMLQLRATGVCVPYEKEYLRKDGSRVSVLLGVALLEGSEEEVIAYALDVTERKRLEAALRRAQRETSEWASELEAIFEAITDQVLVYNRERQLIRNNKAARSFNKLLSQPVYLSRPAEVRLEPYVIRNEQGEPISLEQLPISRILLGEVLSGTNAEDVWVTLPDGREVLLNVTGSPFHDDQGQLMGGVIICRDVTERRRISVAIRLALYERPIAPAVLDPLLAAWRAQRADSDAPSAVRSSALIEDRKGANFAGQFESFLGIADETAFITSVRACWAALWTTNARRYMENHDLSPADTAMAVLIQPLVDARAAGGALSETAEGQMLISATWGLGSAIAQGEVVPDRIVLSRQGFLRKIDAGRKDHREACGHGAGAMPQAVPSELVSEPCLDAGQAVTLGRLLRKAEAVIGSPVEIEWALDDAGFKLLQARPLTVEPTTVPDEIWLKHPGLNGHGAGIGWGAGRAVVVNCECELSRVAPGDVLHFVTWGGGGWGYKGGHSYGVPPGIDERMQEWHKRAHGEQPSDTQTTPPPPPPDRTTV